MPPIRFACRVAALALIPALLLTTACSYQGRVGPTETTDAELEVDEIYPGALIEFSDIAARELVRDLGQIRPIQQTQGPVTILMGDIDNQTRNISSSEFELLMDRFRGRLINSDIAGEKFTFVERRARMRRLAERESVTGNSGAYANPDDYDADRTYSINGNFNRISRGNTNLYYLELQLSKFGSNEIVAQRDYTIKQVN